MFLLFLLSFLSFLSFFFFLFKKLLLLSFLSLDVLIVVTRRDIYTGAHGNESKLQVGLAPRRRQSDIPPSPHTNPSRTGNGLLSRQTDHSRVGLASFFPFPFKKEDTTRSSSYLQSSHCYFCLVSSSSLLFEGREIRGVSVSVHIYFSMQ